MPRRLSPWQQFSANFDSTYGTFNTMFSDIEEGKIMRDEVETIYGEDLGLSPHAAPTKWKYGGQTYDKEITPEQLRGLRNQRLFDNMAKWGDTKGAMEMQSLQADIESKTAGTANLQQKTNLLIAQFPDLAKKIGYENLAIQSGTALSTAQKEKILKMLPHEERYAAAQLVGLNWDNKYLKDTFDAKVNIKEQESLQADITTEEAEIERDISVALKSSDIEAGLAENAETVSSSNLTVKENQIKMSEADEKIAVNDMMARFRNRAGKAPDMGGFSGATEKEQNENAKAWMVSEMRKINLDLADEMEAKYGANELAAVIQESTLFSEKAMASWKTGGIVELSKEIDALNGVNGTEIVYNDKNKNIATLWEVNEKGVKVREIATGDLTKENGEGSFLMNLQQALDPARSMAISTEYHNDLKAQADAEYTAAMAEKAKADTKKSLKETEILGKAKPLSDKEYFVQRLVADPNDTIALHGLLGVDLTRTEIDDLVENETLRAANEAKAALKNKTNKLDDKDGLGKNDPPDEVKKEKVSLNSVEEDLKNAQFIVDTAGTQIGSPTSIGSKKYNDALALIEALTSPAGINAEIKKLNAAIADSLAGQFPNRIQSKNKRKKLKARIKELEASLKGIGGSGG